MCPRKVRASRFESCPSHSSHASFSGQQTALIQSSHTAKGFPFFRDAAVRVSALGEVTLVIYILSVVISFSTTQAVSLSSSSITRADKGWNQDGS